MISSEYGDLRSRVIDATSRMDSTSVCQAGMGGCCVSGVIISQEEVEVLSDALSQGELSPEVISQARNRSRNIKRKSCVFLDDNTGLCSIYQFRPLECIDFGRGALPVTPEARSMLGSLDGGSCSTLSSPDVAQRLCLECARRADEAVDFPSCLVKSSQEVDAYYRSQKKKVRTFRIDQVAVRLYEETEEQ